MLSPAKLCLEGAALDREQTLWVTAVLASLLHRYVPTGATGSCQP